MDKSKFKPGDIVEYVAVYGEFTHLNGSIGIITHGPVKKDDTGTDIGYGVGWVVVMGKGWSKPYPVGHIFADYVLEPFKEKSL